jgi:hypothetical protein
MHLPGGDSVTAINGSEGWMSAPHRPMHTMSDSELEEARLDADLQLPLHLRQAFEKLRSETPEKVGDHDCYVLVGETAGQVHARFYFDQQSGLLVRMLQYAATPLGPNPTRIDYADYRQLAGVQVPYRWTVARPAGQFTVQLTNVTPNQPVPEKSFAKPTS